MRTLAIVLLVIQFLLPSCSYGGAKHVVEFKNSDTLSVKMDGHVLICAGRLRTNPNIAVLDAGKWKYLVTNIPSEFYFGSKATSLRYSIPCDVVDCRKMKEPVDVKILSYENVADTNNTTPVLKTYDIRGKKIKIELPFYSDSKCNEEQIFSKEMLAP